MKPAPSSCFPIAMAPFLLRSPEASLTHPLMLRSPQGLEWMLRREQQGDAVGRGLVKLHPFWLQLVTAQGRVFYITCRSVLCPSSLLRMGMHWVISLGLGLCDPALRATRPTRSHVRAGSAPMSSGDSVLL